MHIFRWQKNTSEIPGTVLLAHTWKADISGYRLFASILSHSLNWFSRVRSFQFKSCAINQGIVWVWRCSAATGKLDKEQWTNKKTERIERSNQLSLSLTCSFGCFPSHLLTYLLLCWFSNIYLSKIIGFECVFEKQWTRFAITFYPFNTQLSYIMFVPGARCHSSAVQTLDLPFCSITHT